MQIKNKFTLVFVLVLSIFIFSKTSFGYPDEEKAQLSLTGVSAKSVQMSITSDNRYLYVGANDDLSIVDLGFFDLALVQPYDITLSADTDNPIGGFVLSTSSLFASQTNGNILNFQLSDITSKPSITTLSSSIILGKMAINSANTKIYIVDTTNNDILVWPIGSTTYSTIPIISAQPSLTDLTITDMILVPSVSGGHDYIYVSTNKGDMFYIIDGNLSATESIIKPATDVLMGMGPSANSRHIYVIDFTAKALLELSSTTLSLVRTIPMIIDNNTSPDTYNTPLSSVMSTSVTNPNSTYTFVSGLKGVSVLDSGLNFIDVSGSGTPYQYTPIVTDGQRYGPMIASTDGYVYMTTDGGVISVISANPYVSVSSVTYSGGGSALVVGGSATITFQSDTTGTFEVKVGGNVDQSGKPVLNQSGTDSGSVTAGVDQTFTFDYDDNSANLDEGDNTIFIFVTDATSDVGRIATTVVVNTPPPAVVVTGASFGNTRVYVNMNRLTVSDMDYYNVYVSDDPAAACGMTVTPTRVPQPSSGSTVVGQVSGLTNGVLYYAAVEPVDDTGLVGPVTCTLPDGVTLITATPEETIGPAQLAGQFGSCSMSNSSSNDVTPLLLLLAVIGIFVVRRGNLFHLSRARGKGSFITIAFLLLLFPKDVLAEEFSPQWWSTEIKGGFWMPQSSVLKRFFEPCCHMTASVEQGFLYDSKYGAEAGIGFVSEDADAVGALSGAKSGDRFNLFLLPVTTSLVFRADFFENQPLVPYVKGGTDYVYFRQDLKGAKVSGMKYGMHGVLGVQILLDKIDSNTQDVMEREFGINDIYFTLEGKYSWINNFGGSGLNLSNLTCSFGLLFEY